MTIYRDAYEQDWRDYDEGLHDPDVIVENARAARLDHMSWPTADIAMERVRPAVRNDDEALAPMRGLLIGVAIGLGFWAAVVGFCAVIA